MLAEIDLVVFDCDGVLVDSEVLSADVLIAELRELGVVIDRDYVRENFLGRSFPTVGKTIRESFQLDLPQDFEASYRRELLARFEHELFPTPGVEAVLESLDVRRCVATSSSPPRVARSLAITGLDRFFGGDVYTASQVKNGKPAPDLFEFAARQMGVAPARTLVIEDSGPGVSAALAAGMRVLLYAGGQHMSGTSPSRDDGVPVFDKWSEFGKVSGIATANGASL